MQKRRSQGFSLIELLIAMAILGIIMAVAVPSYSAYVTESRRVDAQIALRDQAQKMERCRTQTFTYVGCKPTADADSPDGYYTIGFGTPTKSAYTLTATPVTGKSQASDAACTTLTLNQTGLTGATGSSVNTTDPDGDCW